MPVLWWVSRTPPWRRRRDAWVAAGVFDNLVQHAIKAFDRIIGLDLSEVCVDGHQHKAPCGGEGTGPNPTDRGKKGWKWSVLVDNHGVPLSWAFSGANRHDVRLLEPTLKPFTHLQLHQDTETIHLDRGYDAGSVRAMLSSAGLQDHIQA